MVVWGDVVLTVLLKVFTIIMGAILMIVSVLLRPEVLRLLWARSELGWPAISPHRHLELVSSYKPNHSSTIKLTLSRRLGSK